MNTNDDLIGRLIAGPGSRELDAEVFSTVYEWDGLARHLPPEKYTTSIDAALAFAVGLVGGKDAYFKHNEAALNAWADFGGNGWLEALSRYIVAETLKARPE